MALLKIMTSLCIVAVILHTGSALRCYICRPNQNDNCDSNYGTLQECNSGTFEDTASHATASLDRKTLIDTLFAEAMCTKISFRNGFQRIYMRTCMPSVQKLCPSKVEALSYLDPDTRRNLRADCHFCDTDGCNSAGVVIVSPLLALTLFAIAKIVS